MEVTVNKDWEISSRIAAHRVFDTLLQTEGSVGINLATGKSPREFYLHFFPLIKQSTNVEQRLHFFHLDEFLGASPTRNYAHEIANEILAPWSIDSNKIHTWQASTSDIDSHCSTQRSYWLSMDYRIAILGIGENGHVGFNEPGSAVSSVARRMQLTPATRASLRDRFKGEDVPMEALGFGVSEILASNQIILMANGSKKNQIVAKAMLGAIQPSCPASFLRLHDDLSIFLDAEASQLFVQERDLYQEEKVAIGPEKRVEGNILFLSPHPDDTSISAGGFLARHSASNKVKTINMYAGHRSEIPNTDLDERIRIRKAESIAEAKALNISSEFPQLRGYDQNYALLETDIQYVVDQIRDWKPKHIFAPWIRDPHPAHRAATKLLFSALEQIDSLSELEVWFYETPWGLFRPGEMNTFVGLSKSEVLTKLQAIGMHTSQTHRSAYDYAADALTRLRAVVSLEQEFSGYGKAHGIELGKNVECFYKIRAF